MPSEAEWSGCAEITECLEEWMQAVVSTQASGHWSLPDGISKLLDVYISTKNRLALETSKSDDRRQLTMIICTYMSESIKEFLRPIFCYQEHEPHFFISLILHPRYSRLQKLTKIMSKADVTMLYNRYKENLYEMWQSYKDFTDIKQGNIVEDDEGSEVGATGDLVLLTDL